LDPAPAPPYYLRETSRASTDIIRRNAWFQQSGVGLEMAPGDSPGLQEVGRELRFRIYDFGFAI
jgi:hypothetical protein